MGRVGLGDGLWACIAGSWSPAIGDPSAMGWATVGAYLATALVAAAAAGRAKGRERAIWIVAAILCAALAVNKQLDLQSALTAWARCAAKAQGWYEDRQVVQRAFILAVDLGAVVATAAAAIWARHELRRAGLAVAGLGVLTAFVAIRAAGFHHMDELISARLGALRVNWVLEWAGLLLISLNATTRLARPRLTPHGSPPPRRPASARR